MDLITLSTFAFTYAIVCAVPGPGVAAIVEVVRRLWPECTDWPLLCVGHSLGAGVATLLTARLRMMWAEAAAPPAQGEAAGVAAPSPAADAVVTAAPAPGPAPAPAPAP